MNIDEFLDSVAPVSAEKSQSSTVPTQFVPSQSSAKLPPVPTKSNISPSASSSSLQTHTSSDLAKSHDHFESLVLSLETSLASGDFQHAFDTYIAIQSALEHMTEIHKQVQKQCREKLVAIKDKLFSTVQSSSEQFKTVMQDTYARIGQIRELADKGDEKGAYALYSIVKRSIEQLPSLMSEKRKKLDDDLLKVYLYLKDMKERHDSATFATIASEMKQIYIGAQSAIMTNDFANVQKQYELLAAKYAQLPDGFSDQKIQLFDYVTFLHSQLALSPHNSSYQANQNNAQSMIPPSVLNSLKASSQQPATQQTSAQSSNANAPKTNNQPLPPIPSPADFQKSTLPLAPQPVSTDSKSEEIVQSAPQIPEKPVDFAKASSFDAALKIPPPQNVAQSPATTSVPVLPLTNLPLTSNAKSTAPPANVTQNVAPVATSPITKINFSQATSQTPSGPLQSQIKSQIFESFSKLRNQPSENIKPLPLPAEKYPKLTELRNSLPDNDEMTKDSNSKSHQPSSELLQKRAVELTARLGELKRMLEQ